MSTNQHIDAAGRERNGALASLLRFLHAIWLAAVLVIGLLTLISVLSQRPALGAEARPVQGEAETLELAKAEAERLTARFEETLDFEPILDEFFVADAVGRSRRAGDFSTHLEIDPELAARLDERSLRRAYAAMMTAFHLERAYVLGSVRLDTDEEDELALPAGVDQRMDAIEAMGPVTTHESFFEAVAELEEIVRLYRGAVTHATVASPIYEENRATMAKWRSRAGVEHSDVDSGYLKYGVPEGEAVYEVYMGGFWYSFVETRDGLKVVAVGFAGM